MSGRSISASEWRDLETRSAEARLEARAARARARELRRDRFAGEVAALLRSASRDDRVRAGSR